MRARSTEVLVFALLAIAGGAVSRASAQDQQEEKKKDKDPAGKPKATDAQSGAPSVAEQQQQQQQDVTETLVNADPAAWQSLAQDLFISGERGVADPGRVEPEAHRILKFGDLEILPKLDEEIVYDDNVFLTEHDRTKDFILRTEPGVLADYSFGGGAHHFSAGYEMIRNYFIQGDADNFTEQLASAELDLSFDHLHVTLGDRWEDRTDPILAVFTGKIHRWINTAHGDVALREDNWYGEIKAQRVSSRYDDVQFREFDRDEDLGYFEAGSLAQEEMWVFARVGAIDRLFDQNQLNDMKGALAAVGIRMTRGESFDAMARIGVRAEKFDNTAPTDSDDSAVNPDLEARLLWRATRTGALDFRGVHTTEFSPDSNYEVLDRAEVNWNEALDERLLGRIGIGIEHINPSNTSPTFWHYVLGGGLRYALAPNADLTLGWRTRWRETSAPNESYTGDQITFGVSVRL